MKPSKKPGTVSITVPASVPAESGFVYYAQCSETGRIKIGFSTDVGKRMVSLNQGSPTRVEVVATEPGTLELEAERHGQFRPAMVPGLASREWFYPVPELLDFIHGLGDCPLPVPGAAIPNPVSAYYSAKAQREDAITLRRDVEVATLRLRPLYELVATLMRVRHGPSHARTHRPLGLLEVSARAAREAEELSRWLRPLACRSMLDGDRSAADALGRLLCPLLTEAAPNTTGAIQ